MKTQRRATVKMETVLQKLSAGVNPEVIVDDWIAKYKKNQVSGVLDLVQLLCDAAGHNIHLTIQNMEEENAKNLIDTLEMTIPEDKNAPIMNKRVKVCCAVFFQKLISKCNNLLFDTYLLDTFFKFLIPMSLNSLRAFRYVSTLVGLKVMTALVNVLIVSFEHLSIAQQQLSAEQSKNIISQSSDRIELLEAKISELQSNEKELTEVLQDFLVKIIFKRRILDKMPEIQIMCLNEAVSWMQICPDMFIVDHHLGYFKLLMGSPIVSVREAVLTSLLFLFETQTLTENLKFFVTKCTNSLIQLTLDRSTAVSVAALNLLTEIKKAYGPQLFEEHKESIFHLVFSRHKQVACAAGSFFIAWLNTQTNMEPSHVSILLSLVQFFEEAHRPNHAPFMVEALLHKCPALVDWEAMCFVLIQESRAMTAEQETCFLRIMTASMEQACTGTHAQASKPMVTAKAEKLRNTHKLKITEHFTEHLPRLLHKYRDDADKVVMLLQFVKYFKLERIFPFKKEILNTLVKCLENLAEIHSDKRVLRGICDVMKFIDSELHSALEPGYLQLINSIEGNLFRKFIQTAEILQKHSQEDTLPSDNQIFTLINTMEKLVIFYECRDQKWKNLWNICLNYITHSLEHSQFPVEFIINCIKICHLNILWDRTEMKRNPDEHTEDTALSLQSKVLQLLLVLQQLLTHEMQEFNETVFFIVCDILLVFCKNCEPIYPDLGVSADDTLQNLLQKYVKKTVFAKVKRGKTFQFRQSVLKSYCKLASYGMLKMADSIWIFNYYNKGRDHEDILKKTFANMLESDEIECAEALMNMLASSFRILLEGQNRNTQSVKQIMRAQFVKYSQLLAANPHALTHFHKQGIHFAYEKGTSSRDNKIFLEILMEFVESLAPQQCLTLLELLKSLEEETEECQSALSYHTSLKRRSKVKEEDPKKRRKTPARLSDVSRSQTSTSSAKVQDLRNTKMMNLQVPSTSH